VQVWAAQVGGVGKEDALLDARTDAEAVQAWIAARCSTPATVRSYSREAQRLMLWLVRERGGRRFAQMRVEDCLAYQAFLQHVPPSWISRDRAAPGQLGWAPFRGPLSVASQVQATRILGGLFAWLAAAKYLAGNPWLLVNTDTGAKDQVTQVLETHAISEGAMAHIHGFLAQQVPSASCQRMQFIVSFVAAVGLRSAELLDARLGAFAWQPEGWTMRVTGKGAKTRTVFVPRPAMEALQIYLAQRGMGGLESAPPDAPLLASTLDAMAPIGYQALYLSVRRWFAKAVSASPLSSRERAELVGASTHWLRHTFGTTAVAREVPYDVIQQQMGHASVNTTMNIYARAPLKRRAQELGKAFG
jgi:integrase